MKTNPLRFLAASAVALLCGLIQPVVAAEIGVQDGKILLGMSTPQTGIIASLGKQQTEGIQAYFSQINAAGGINGRKVELVTLDDAYDPAKTVANTKKLIEEDKVFALVGYIGTATTTEAMKVFAEAKVPLVGTLTGADSLRNPVNRYLFLVRGTYGDEAEAIVNHQVSLGIKNIAVFYQNDAYGKAGLEAVTRALDKHKLKPVALGTVERGSIKVEEAVKSISKVSPQSVIIFATAKPLIAFVKQIKAAGLSPSFSTPSTASLDELVKELGPDSRGIGISQVFPFPWNDTVPVVKEYQKAIQTQTGGKNYSYYSLEGYITAKLMTEAMRRSGKDLTREKLVQTLEAMGDVDLGGFRLNYSPSSHSGSRFVDLTVIGRDGKVLH